MDTPEKFCKLKIEDVCALVDGKTLAVVGNASALRQTRHGEDIDTADLVVRFNLARPPKGPDIPDGEDLRVALGTRMDVWAGWQSTVQQKIRQNAYRKRWQRRSYREADLGGWNERVQQAWIMPFGNTLPSENLRPKAYMGSHPHEKARVSIGIERATTTGCSTVWMLLTMTKAKHLNLYGFDGLRSGSMFSGSDGGGHSGSKEYNWLREQPRVTIH